MTSKLYRELLNAYLCSHDNKTEYKPWYVRHLIEAHICFVQIESNG